MRNNFNVISAVDQRMFEAADRQKKEVRPTMRCNPRLQVDLLFDGNSGTPTVVRVSVIQRIETSNGIPGDSNDYPYYQTDVPFDGVSMYAKEMLVSILHERFIEEIRNNSFSHRLGISSE